MPFRRMLDLPRPIVGELDGSVVEPPPRPLASRADCLEEILQAFRDIADRDDIHQAAHRLVLVQEWIRNEAQRAAADPIFLELRLV
jgi:hypothetical protein